MSTYLLPYITGTVATTSGSSTVTGTLTAWLSQVQPGDNFRIGSASAIVASVDSNTQITLLTTWTTTATGQSYAIDRWSQGHSAPGTLALRNSQLLESLGTGYTMQSPTSLAIGVGSKTFDVAAGVPILPGARMLAASRANLANAMWGTVTSYSGTTLVLNVETVSGSGTFSDWNINIAGGTTQGAPGEITRSGSQTGGVPIWISNSLIGQATKDQILTQIKMKHQTTTINDDSVMTVAMPASISFALIFSNSGIRPMGTAHVRAVTAPAVVVANMTGTFGNYATPLSGTTGTDGQINFGADGSGNFYIENRIGMAVIYTVVAFTA